MGGQPLPTELCVNEIMPQNVSTIADEKGAFGDWIELHNPTDSAIDLSGWSISDDPNLDGQFSITSGLTARPGPWLGMTLVARDWNVPASGAGYVTRFAVDAAYLARYPEQVAGGRAHTEHWIPAEELDAFNDHIIGPIEVIAAFPRDGAPGSGG